MSNKADLVQEDHIEDLKRRCTQKEVTDELKQRRVQNEMFEALKKRFIEAARYKTRDAYHELIMITGLKKETLRVILFGSLEQDADTLVHFCLRFLSRRMIDMSHTRKKRLADLMLQASQPCGKRESAKRVEAIANALLRGVDLTSYGYENDESLMLRIIVRFVWTRLTPNKRAAVASFADSFCKTRNTTYIQLIIEMLVPETLGDLNPVQVYNNQVDQLNLAEEIRLERTDIGWSQQELAEYAGLDQAQISKYESGIFVPSHKSIRKLTAALGLSYARKGQWLEAARKQSKHAPKQRPNISD